MILGQDDSIQASVKRLKLLLKSGVNAEEMSRSYRYCSLALSKCSSR